MSISVKDQKRVEAWKKEMILLKAEHSRLWQLYKISETTYCKALGHYSIAFDGIDDLPKDIRIKAFNDIAETDIWEDTTLCY